jgi:hypothetical protein
VPADPAATTQQFGLAANAADLGKVTAQLSVPAQQELRQQIASTIAGLLDLDLGRLIVNGWRNYLGLTAAAKSTLATPGTTKTVDLAAHRIRSTYRPHIDVFIDGVRVARIEIALNVTLDITFAVAVVQDGRLMGIRGGQCDIQAVMAIEDIAFPPRHQQIELWYWRSLGAGIPLCAPPLDDGTRPTSFRPMPGTDHTSQRPPV